uniref:Uncharacterized protein n=1 Tax=Anopheles minimus TaxID=112268 RepID=A0A182WMW1_9DIPT
MGRPKPCYAEWQQTTCTKHTTHVNAIGTARCNSFAFLFEISNHSSLYRGGSRDRSHIDSGTVGGLPYVSPSGRAIVMLLRHHPCEPVGRRWSS